MFTPIRFSIIIPCDSSVRAGLPGFDFRHGQGFVTFATAVSRLALGPTHPPMKWSLGVVSLGVKRPEGKANHIPPSSAEVKNVWSYIPTSPYVFMIGA